MTIFEILGIIIIHWFADFVLQTEEEAVGKSHSLKLLLSHTINYSIFTSGILMFLMIFFNLYTYKFVIYFGAITFFFHTATDFFTSKLNKKLAPKSVVLKIGNKVFGGDTLNCYPTNAKWHNFFVGIGFDQVLHYIQLFLTFYLLK